VSNEEQWTTTFDGQDYFCEVSEADTWSIVRNTPYGTESVGQVIIEDGAYVAYPQDLPTAGAPLGFGPFDTFADAATELVTGTP
jgi:hypothetical protein